MIPKQALVFILLFFCNPIFASAQFQTKMQIQKAKAINDSFEIYISLPKSYNKKNVYDVVYYLDANIKSGKALRTLLKNDSYNNNVKNKIFVGVGHIGNFHVLRQRDFLPATIKEKDTLPKNKNYGHADDFYIFLTKELMPYVSANYKINELNNSLIGHSYGGFFCFYILFKNVNLFKNYYALSPSLWEANYSIFKFNKIANKGLNKTTNLYFTAGGLEFANYILTGNKKMEDFLNQKKYVNLNYTYNIVPYQNHNTAVPISIKEILDKME